MAKVALDLSQFKSAGVYTVEVDQSERIQVTTQSLRLVPGFSSQGPYNAPVFIRSGRDLTKFYGPIDQKLERKGSFFQRSIDTCLLSSPVFALNLINVNTDPTIDASVSRDHVEYIALSIDTSISNRPKNNSMYVNFFNRDRFWIPDETYLQSVINNSVSASNNYSGPLFSLVNIGTKDISFIIRKAVGLQGFAITATDWYGTAENIPYEWIRAYDLMEDFFIEIIAFEGNWTNYVSLATDPYYSSYFTNSTDASGLLPSQINNFINSNQVRLIGSWTGCIIPNFKDQTGSNQFIETIVNNATSLTGVFLTINQDALDQLIWDEYDTTPQWEIGDGANIASATYLVDLIGHNLIDNSAGQVADNSIGEPFNFKFLSYDVDVSYNVFHQEVSCSAHPASDTTGKRFAIAIDACVAGGAAITVGTYLKSGAAIQPGITRVNNKYHDGSTFIFETDEPVWGSYNANNVTTQMKIEDPSVNRAYKLIQLTGLRIYNRHTPGFDKNGAVNVEEGVSKIYEMLLDTGILRGLTNPDMINYRYIVDTMANGLQANMGGKQNLSSLAKKRGKCTAILNAPSIKQFAASTNPYFGNTYVSGVDPVPIFNTEYIPEGGNPDMARSFKFTLPDEELGSKYCGVFGPFLRYNEGGRIIDVPPAADVANAYVRKFLGGNPYAIVANQAGILSNPNLVGVEYMIDKTDRDYLEPFGYNSIIERPGTGQIMIYANSTAYQTVLSDYNNLHVRELLNTLELQVDEVLQNYIWDFNNPITRLNIINSVSPIFETAKDAGAIYKYEIVMDEVNNTKEIIAEGFGIIDFGLWITGALSKIIARYTVNTNAGLSSGGFTT